MTTEDDSRRIAYQAGVDATNAGLDGRMYRVTIYKRDGSVSVHEHLSGLDLMELGFEQDWESVERADFEAEDGD